MSTCTLEVVAGGGFFYSTYRKNIMRGNKPKLSSDPRQERMLVIRVPGALHTLIAKKAAELKISMNRLIVETMRARVNNNPEE